MNTYSISKGIVYYTDGYCDPAIIKMCQNRLLSVSKGCRIVSVSLSPIDFGENIVVPLTRSYETMFKQILVGLSVIDTDIIFLCEHDVLYTEEHFKFIPSRNDFFYYNINNWFVRVSDGYAIYFWCKKVSQLCSYRELALTHYSGRIKKIENDGKYMWRTGFEPGVPGRVDSFGSLVWETPRPNLDLRHDKNLTRTGWTPEGYRNPCRDWRESHVNKLPGWEDLILPGGLQ
jgi:hypothetical protein